MFYRLSIYVLLLVIIPLDCHMYFYPEFYYRRNDEEFKAKNEEEISVGSQSYLRLPLRRRYIRHVESTTETAVTTDATELIECEPTSTTATSTSGPVQFFFTFGSPPDWNNPKPEPKASNEDTGEKNNEGPGGSIFDVRSRRPCYPRTTKYPKKNPFHSNTQFHNPFLPSSNNNFHNEKENNNNFFNNFNKYNNNPFGQPADKDNSFNKHINNVENNPFTNFFNNGSNINSSDFLSNSLNSILNNSNNNNLLRGGVVVGSPPFSLTPTEPTERKANVWCTKFQSDCAKREDDERDLNTRIIGGRPATPRDHTHMVMIGYGTADEKHWLCGGSLISSSFVLSAAHCTTGQWGKAKWARLGDLDLSSKTDDANPQERLIVQHFNHPDYKEPAVYNDIAVYKLDNEVTLNEWVAPICLHTKTSIPILQVIVTGWGRTDFVSETSPILMEVEIGIYNNSECKKLMDKTSSNKLPNGIDAKTMVCAGVSQGGKDACSGDSGGPLIMETSKCTKTQIGITSIGRECGLPDAPGVYTRISPYVSWIESIVWS